MRAATVLVLLLLGCEREPAIVIRFDPVDLAGRDLSRPSDLSAVPDRAGPRDLGAQQVAKAPAAAACASDADCVLVTDGCCDCANGGKQRAVPRRSAKTVDSACKDVMCTMMMSTDPSCGKRAACVEHACALRQARADELPHRLPGEALVS